MKSNIKKTTALLITAVLCLCFTSCVNNASVTINNNDESNTEQSTTVSASTLSEEESSAQEETTTATTEKADNKNSSNKTTAKATTAKSTTAKSTTAKSTTEKNKTTCTLTIECKAILSNMNDLKDGHEKYVPSDGYILRNYAYCVNSGDTVFDALEYACESNSIVLNSNSTGFGVYVAGINNLDEKDCGSQSGWKYKVNGVDADRSCGYYKLSGGENIVFYYTVTA